MRETDRLQQAIDSAISQNLGAALVTATDISDVVIEENRDLIRDLADELARRWVRRMVGSKMKTVSLDADSSRQASLFSDLKGLPMALSMESEGEVKYIARRFARRKEWAGHIEYLTKLWKADRDRCKLVIIANKRLEELRAQYGDLTESELIAVAAREVA